MGQFKVTIKMDVNNGKDVISDAVVNFNLMEQKDVVALQKAIMNALANLGDQYSA